MNDKGDNTYGGKASKRSRSTTVNDRSGLEPDHQVITAMLERPVPVVGLHSQYLGVVRRSHMKLDDGRVQHWELQTKWQMISLEHGEVQYDHEDEVFRLMKQPPRP